MGQNSESHTRGTRDKAIWTRDNGAEQRVESAKRAKERTD